MFRHFYLRHVVVETHCWSVVKSLLPTLHCCCRNGSSKAWNSTGKISSKFVEICFRARIRLALDCCDLDEAWFTLQCANDFRLFFCQFLLGNFNSLTENLTLGAVCSAFFSSLPMHFHQSQIPCVILHLNGQTPVASVEIASSLEPTQNDAFSLKTEQKRTTTKSYSCTCQINSFFVIAWC